MKLALSRKNLWDKAPRALKRTVGRLLGVVPPAYLLGRRFRAMLRFVDEAQWWSAERAREFQLERLREICTLAYERTSYYRQAFDAIGMHPAELTNVEGIAALPTIDKETVRDNIEQMMVVASNARHVDYVSTGGSSGTTLRFYIGRDRSAIEYAYLVSSWQRVGYRLGMPMAVIRGRVLKTGERHEYDALLRHHYYSNFDMSDDNIRWYLEHMKRIGPCFLHVYPSAAVALAAYCRRSGVVMPENVRGVLAESEMVYPEQRAMIDSLCGTRMFSSYGHCEKLVSAAECEHTQNYHVWPTYGYFELLNDAGQPITECGQSGEIVGTGFINRVVPFIRYRTGDFATYAGDRCGACGREHILLSKIDGRWPRGALVASDGFIISATALNLHDDTFEGIREYQFYQDKPGEAELRVVPIGALRVETLQRVARGLERKLRGRVRIRLKVVNRIKLTPAGKFRLVDQRIENAEPLTHAHTTGR